MQGIQYCHLSAPDRNTPDGHYLVQHHPEPAVGTTYCWDGGIIIQRYSWGVHSSTTKPLLHDPEYV